MLERPDRRRAASARQRRYRRRACAGRIMVTIEVGEALLGLLLRPGPQGTGWLAEADTGDRGAIRRAIEAMLADAVGWRGRC